MSNSKARCVHPATFHSQTAKSPICEVDPNMKLTTVTELLSAFTSNKRQYVFENSVEDAAAAQRINRGKRQFVPDLNDQSADNFRLVTTPEVESVVQAPTITREFLNQLEMDKIPAVKANPHDEDTKMLNRVKLFLANSAMPSDPRTDQPKAEVDKEPLYKGQGSNAASQRTIVTKYASAFFLDMNPSQEVKLIFPEFSTKYNLPTVVSLTDPRSNFAKVGIMQRGACCYLNQGWNQFVRFYSVYGGKWVRMLYINEGQFRVNVYKENSIEINYPKLDYAITGGHLDPPLIAPPIDSSVFYEPPYFVGTYKKTISYEEAVGHRLKIALLFAVKALPFHDGNIEIIDPNGTHWPCSFVHKTDDPEFGAIFQGWFALNRKWQLSSGTNITFAVKKHHTRSLHMLLE